MKIKIKIKFIYLCLVQFFLVQTYANAESDIKKFINDALENNNEIINLKKQTNESELGVEEAYTVYYPKVTLNAEAGEEGK